MKRSLAILISVAVALAFGACNKHSWDEEVDHRIPTKEVFKPHGHHGSHDGDHGDHADHEVDAHAKGDEDHSEKEPQDEQPTGE